MRKVTTRPLDPSIDGSFSLFWYIFQWTLYVGFQWLLKSGQTVNSHQTPAWAQVGAKSLRVKHYVVLHLLRRLASQITLSLQSKPPTPDLDGTYTINSDHNRIWVTKICQADIVQDSDDRDNTATRVVNSVCSESWYIDVWLKQQGFLCISIYERYGES